MKLTLQNIGIVHSAELELKGLTIVTGYNGIGKSIVGKALYCALSARYEGRYEGKYEPDETTNNYLKNILKLINIIEIGGSKEASEQGKKILENSLTSDVEILEGYFKHRFILGNNKVDRRTFETLKKISDIFILKSGNYKLNKTLEYLEKNNLILTSDADIYNLEHNELIQSTFKNSYNNKLIPEKHSLLEFYKEQETIVKVEVVNNKTTTIDFTQDVFSDILLIETPTILSLFRYIKENLAFNNNQNKLLPDYIKGLIQKLSESSYTPNYDKPICKSIQEIIKGRVIIENEQLFYEDESKEKHAITNVATGIKSLGMLQLLLAGDAILPGSLLVIDEPEVHLHPAWQLEYARVIVELVKEGVEVIINSHSSYFIEALDVYTKNEQITDKFHVYLGEMEEQGSVFREVTQDLEPVFSAFAKPMVKLMVEENMGKRERKQQTTQSLAQEPTVSYKTKDTDNKEA